MSAPNNITIKHHKYAHDRPDIVITVEREVDSLFEWDGDGPDPTEDGFIAYDVDVRATTIYDGEFIMGSTSLGGSYYRYEDPIGDVHGYLDQMIDEAIKEMDRKLAIAKLLEEGVEA